MELKDVLKAYDGREYDKAMANVYKGLISRPHLMSLIPNIQKGPKHIKVLEVFCGTGLNLPSYPKEVILTAIDIHPKMLQVARQLPSTVERNQRIILMDARKMDFLDGSFDLTVESLGLCVTPNPKKALKEMTRVTKKGGYIVVFDMCLSPVPSTALAQNLMKLRASKVGIPERVIVWDPTLNFNELTRGLPLTLVKKEIKNQNTPWCCAYYVWKVTK